MTMVDHDPAKGESHDPTSSRPGRVRKGVLVVVVVGGRVDRIAKCNSYMDLVIRKREDVLS